jgi:ABC-type multidrug transport system ATPase subunit
MCVVADKAIVVEGLRKRFGDVTALDAIELEVPRGRSSGCSARTGLPRRRRSGCWPRCFVPMPDTEVLGYDVVRQASAVRRRIGLAGQAAAVDPNLTGRDDLRMVGILGQMPRADVKRRAVDLLERLDLTEAADRHA